MALIFIAALALAAAWRFRDRWQPLAARTRDALTGVAGRDRELHTPSDSHSPNDDHARERGSSDDDRLHLSPQALKNLGLTPELIQPVRLSSFERSITVPAMVAVRPGRTHVEVSTPMAGVITHIHALQGEAVTPGTLLFELRITAEELVDSQTALLTTVGELDVEERELVRLEKVTDSGAVPLKTRLEHEYARDKLLALRDAQREALRLHGLSEPQIEELQTRRRLLRDLRIVAPHPDDHAPEEFKLTAGVAGSAAAGQPRETEDAASHGVPGEGDASSHNHDAVPDSRPGQRAAGRDEANNHDDIHGHDERESGQAIPASSGAHEVRLVLHEVRIHKGQTVAAGETLAVLADYSELYIEGRAFEADLPTLADAARNQRKATAIFDLSGGETTRLPDLDIVFSGSEVGSDSRTLPFYVRLPNTIATTSKSPNGFEFIDWTYRPGQRLQLQIPVERWENQIVLPLAALAREGAETYVFQQSDDDFERIPVHVRYRNQESVVVANDGSLTPGNRIALKGAQRMLMALKNQGAGPLDPHAGHDH